VADGIFTVRSTGGPPRELQFRPDSEPAGFALNLFDEQIAAYVILQIDWLQSAQRGATPLISTR